MTQARSRTRSGKTPEMFVKFKFNIFYNMIKNINVLRQYQCTFIKYINLEITHFKVKEQ